MLARIPFGLTTGPIEGAEILVAGCRKETVASEMRSNVLKYRDTLMRVSLKAPSAFLLAQPPKIVSKDLTPGLQCRFFVPSSLIVLSLFDAVTSLSKRFEIALFDFLRPFARYIHAWIHRIQDDHQIVGTLD